MILEAILFFGLFHHKHKPVPGPTIHQQYFQSALNSLKAYEDESDNSQFFLDDQIATIRQDFQTVESSRNEKEFNRNVDTLHKHWDEMKEREIIWTHFDVI